LGKAAAAATTTTNTITTTTTTKSTTITTTLTTTTTVIKKSQTCISNMRYLTEYRIFGVEYSESIAKHENDKNK